MLGIPPAFCRRKQRRKALPPSSQPGNTPQPQTIDDGLYSEIENENGGLRNPQMEREADLYHVLDRSQLYENHAALRRLANSVFLAPWYIFGSPEPFFSCEFSANSLQTVLVLKDTKASSHAASHHIAASVQLRCTLPFNSAMGYTEHLKFSTA